MRCPHCHNKLLQKSGSTTRLRIQGVVEFTDGSARAQCYWCKQQVSVPVELKKAADDGEELFILTAPTKTHA